MITEAVFRSYSQPSQAKHRASSVKATKSVDLERLEHSNEHSVYICNVGMRRLSNLCYLGVMGFWAGCLAYIPYRLVNPVDVLQINYLYFFAGTVPLFILLAAFLNRDFAKAGYTLDYENGTFQVDYHFLGISWRRLWQPHDVKYVVFRKQNGVVQKGMFSIRRIPGPWWVLYLQGAGKNRWLLEFATEYGVLETLADDLAHTVNCPMYTDENA